MIPLPSTRWFRKPPPQFTKLNRAHPLARGLVDMWVFNNGGGGQEGLVHPERVFVPVMAAFYLPYWGAGLGGVGAQSYVNTGNGGSGHYEATNTENVNYMTGDFTIRVRFEPISIGDTYTTTIAKDYNGSSRELGFFMGSGSITYMDVGGTTGFQTGSEGLFVGGLFDFVVIRSGTTVTTYVNGVLKSTFTSQSGVLGGNNKRLMIGYDAATGAHAGWWNYHAVQIWNRALSTVEIQQLTFDPYGTLMPPNTWALHGVFTSSAFIAQQNKLISQAVNRASTY